jgi:hypothetical protein
MAANRSTLALVAAAAVLAAGTLASAADAATTPRVTPARAERNVLHAVRALARWHVGLADPHTGLLPANTTASCTGRGKSRRGAFSSLNCVIRHQTLRVSVLYVALRHNGFELRHHAVVHP